MTKRDDESAPPEVRALFETLDNAKAGLSYEEKEGLADALRAGGESRFAAVSPRGAPFLKRLRSALRDIETAEGPDSAAYWTGVAVNDVTEPLEGREPTEMTDDELERERDRRRRYGNF